MSQILLIICRYVGCTTQLPLGCHGRRKYCDIHKRIRITEKNREWYRIHRKSIDYVSKRNKILFHLQEFTRVDMKSLMEIFDTSQPSLSAHVVILRNEGHIIYSDKRAKQYVYGGLRK